MNRSVKKAYAVAAAGLNRCVCPLGILCGMHHFTDLWARDSLFATFGTSALGDYRASRKTIESFLRYQLPDGIIPYRILRSPTTIAKYFGKPQYYKNPKADFRSHQSAGLVPDGGLMAILAIYEYVRQSGDKTFLQHQYQKLQLAASWYTKRYRSELISEWFLCEWADSVLKFGKTLYTNVLYAAAMQQLASLAHVAGSRAASRVYTEMADRITQQLTDVFWNGTYFVDWVDYRRQQYFSSHGNLLAIWFGLATDIQARSILRYIKEYCLMGYAVRENVPSYPWWRIPVWNYLVGLGDYHNNGCLWLQPAIWYALCLYKLGHVQRARSTMSHIAGQIVRWGDVYEIYGPDGSPVKRAFYQAEHPFAWSAGLYVYAAHTIT